VLNCITMLLIYRVTKSLKLIKKDNKLYKKIK
jgi:hypothetical protein